MNAQLLSNLKALLRTVVLVLLLVSGLWLMDQVAQNTIAGRSRGSMPAQSSEPTNPTVSQPANPPGIDPSRPVQGAGDSGTSAGARATIPPSAEVPGETPPSPEGQAGKTFEPPASAPVTAKPFNSRAAGVLDDREQSPALRILRRAEGQYIATEPVLFSTASSEIRQVSLQPLRRVAALLKERPDIKLMIVGYTDNLGVPENNLRVSGERAAAVEEFLVGQGIDRSRLESRGMGSQNPIATNDTQLGRQANRRIEFVITNPK